MSILLLIRGSFEYKFGIGKSYLALKLGELIDPHFSIDKVVFEPKDFKRAMQLMERKKHQVMVIDEAGILVNAKKWQSFINHSVRAAMMTFRNLESMCILVSPDISYIDSDIRKMITFVGECHKFIKNNYEKSTVECYVQAKFYKLNWGTFDGKPYVKRIAYFDKNAKGIKLIGPLKIQLPSENLIQEYEKRASEYKKKVRSAAESFEDFINATQSPEEIIKDILENRRDLIFNNRITMNDVRFVYGTSRDVASYVARRVNNILKGGKSE